MARFAARGVWLIQGFVVLVAALLVLRFLAAPERHRPVALEGSPADGMSPGRPRVPPQVDRSAKGDLQLPGKGKEHLEAVEADSSRRGPSPAQGAPYAPEQFGTQLVADEPCQKVWRLDRRELIWMRDHRREVLTADLAVRPRPAGGLQITDIHAGSFAAARGLRVGDVLVEINGRVLDAVSDLEDFIDNVASWASGGWRITLERERSTVLLDYLPPSEAGSRRREH